MTAAYDILTFGDMCVDVALSGHDVTPQFGQVEKWVEDYLVEMGGSCPIFACQAAKLGLRTAILGRVGDDDFGRLMLRRLNESGVDTRFVQVEASLKTGMGVALCQGDDRAILTYPGTLNAVYPADVTPELLASARHLHHGSYFLHTNLRPGMVEIFRQARGLGLSTSLDTNWDPQSLWDGDLPQLLALTDIFFPNDQEARHISRQNGLPEAIAALLALGVGLVAVKRGPGGAQVVTLSESHDCQVPPAPPGGDSIGAGDSFDAGFLAGWLRGLPLQTCLQIACQCGRGCASARGGIAGQPRWSELKIQDRT
jgi:ribokinase